MTHESFSGCNSSLLLLVLRSISCYGARTTRSSDDLLAVCKTLAKCSLLSGSSAAKRALGQPFGQRCILTMCGDGQKMSAVVKRERTDDERSMITLPVPRLQQ